MEYTKLLKDLTLLSGVSGNEKPVRKFMENELKDISDNMLKDNLGSVAFEFKGTSCSPNILVVGHLDEIGFMVHSVSSKGLIKFTNLGGWDPRTLMSSPVEIINREGEKIIGLIGSVPVHHLKDTSGKLSIDDMYIDIGAESPEEVREIFKIRKGDFIVPVPHYALIEKKNIMISKAFDDRVGIAIAIATGKHFKDKNHPNTIFCAGSVQEEVGTRGAQTISQLIKPDIAIVLEGSPGDDFPTNKEEMQAKMNAGVQIRMIDPTMICNPDLVNFAIDVAEELKIPYQLAVRKSGGTDAGKIHVSGLGVPTIVLAAPVRYAHSHNGMLSLKDFQATLDLTIALIERMNSDFFLELIK
ncbi:MAG: M20/M25/M40 family metallo-hydrolase [Candidatus Cloacimonetes bacterium]|nr:M20/M25/M40 family metallo-hydrolase [Candidatus Cloacimonadota bacterium]